MDPFQLEVFRASVIVMRGGGWLEAGKGEGKKIDKVVMFEQKHVSLSKR